MGKIMASLKNMMGFEDENIYDEYEELEEEAVEEAAEERKSYSMFSARKEPKMPREESKVVSLHGKHARISIVKPSTFDEAPDICDALKENRIVVVNTAGLEPRTAQRLLDFMSGSCYALAGDVQEVENGVYVLSPATVEVTRDEEKQESGKGLLNWK